MEKKEEEVQDEENENEMEKRKGEENENENRCRSKFVWFVWYGKCNVFPKNVTFPVLLIG